MGTFSASWIQTIVKKPHIFKEGDYWVMRFNHVDRAFASIREMQACMRRGF